MPGSDTPHLHQTVTNPPQSGWNGLITYQGKSGITTLLPYLIGDDAGLVSIVSGKGSAYMTFFRSAFERCAPKSVSAVEAALGTELKQGNSTREFAQPLLDALTLAHREAVGNHHADQSAD